MYCALICSKGEAQSRFCVEVVPQSRVCIDKHVFGGSQSQGPVPFDGYSQRKAG